MKVINIVLLGHKDHGKSTLLGSLLMQTGAATQVRIKEAEEYSKRLHKTFEPAFILDSFAEERLREMTIDTTRAEITYKGLAFALIDVPGHEGLIKNMISGASYGEVALLLVSAKKNEGIRDQTKRHLFIARMLGIDKLVVAVNKMDLAGYKKEKFESIRNELTKFIEHIGFRRENVFFVPISAYNKDNLLKRSDKMPWYRGKPLLDLIYDNARIEEKLAGRPLRIVLQGFIDSDQTIAGKVVSGSVKVGDSVVVLPQNFRSTVGEIFVKMKKTRRAVAGKSVAIRLKDRIDSDTRGSVMSGTNDMPKPTTSVRALIFVTHPMRGDVRIKFNDIDIDCDSLKIVRVIDTTTGEQKRTSRPGNLDAIEADLAFGRRLPFENYAKTQELGRFVLHSNDRFAGIGIVE